MQTMPPVAAGGSSLVVRQHAGREGLTTAQWRVGTDSGGRELWGVGMKVEEGAVEKVAKPGGGEWR